MRMRAFAMISQPTGSAKDTIQIRLRICNDKRFHSAPENPQDSRNANACIRYDKPTYW